MKLMKLVFMRHGESEWNKENRFTGWTDIDLSEQGRIEAKKAGGILKKEGYLFDYAYTSLLKRAIHTLWIILDELDQSWLPVEKSWRLNERHYGALQGLNKIETAKKYGEEQVKQWRRSLKISPPELNSNDKSFPGKDIRYSNLTMAELPTTESLKSTIKRVVPYWKGTIWPRLQRHQKIIIVAHGNSIRAIVKFLDNLNEKDVFELNIPNAIPLVYEFDESMRPINHYYLDIDDVINTKGDRLY